VPIGAPPRLGNDSHERRERVSILLTPRVGPLPGALVRPIQAHPWPPGVMLLLRLWSPREHARPASPPASPPHDPAAATGEPPSSPWAPRRRRLRRRDKPQVRRSHFLILIPSPILQSKQGS
jgi:hypothetical protein